MRFTNETPLVKETILVRESDNPGKYKILDGIHRLIGACLEGKKTIIALVPMNENGVLPICEAHTIYDLIRGFIRHRHNKDGETELYYGLKLLLNTYANTQDLLKNRFNKKWVDDEKTQNIIKKVLED